MCAFRPGEMVPSGKPETILSGMPPVGDHPMHPFVIDAKGNLFVDSGSATNSCQSENRMPDSAGIQPCTELETRTGIWRYDANKTGQSSSPTQLIMNRLEDQSVVCSSAAIVSAALRIAVA